MSITIDHDAPAKHEGREMVGGPFDGEMIVFHTMTTAATMPMPKKWRRDPATPEWCKYVLRGDYMIFVARGTDKAKVMGS